jgi:hypothetical protein
MVSGEHFLPVSGGGGGGGLWVVSLVVTGRIPGLCLQEEYIDNTNIAIIPEIIIFFNTL